MKIERKQLSKKALIIYSLIAAIVGVTVTQYIGHRYSEKLVDPDVAALYAVTPPQPQEPSAPQEVVPSATGPTPPIGDQVVMDPNAFRPETLPLTQYHYVGAATVQCTDSQGNQMDCAEVVKHVPMLSPTAIADHWCEGGVCMNRGSCDRVVGADPVYANPKEFGIQDWGAYYQISYHKHGDSAVCK